MRNRGYVNFSIFLLFSLSLSFSIMTLPHNHPYTARRQSAMTKSHCLPLTNRHTTIWPFPDDLSKCWNYVSYRQLGGLVVMAHCQELPQRVLAPRHASRCMHLTRRRGCIQFSLFIFISFSFLHHLLFFS